MMLAAGALGAGLAFVGPAGALPANPWTGQWVDGSGSPIVLSQSGSSITGTGRAACTGNPTGVAINGTASADNTAANFSYSGAPACPGEGGTFTGKMRPDGRVVDISGVTQFGTGFQTTWTYQGGGTEPRSTPTSPPPPPRTTTTTPTTPRPAGAVRFSYVGYSNDLVPVTLRRFQLGVVRILGGGGLRTNGTASAGSAHRASIDERRFGYGFSSMRAVIRSGSVVRNTARTRILRLQAQVVSSNNSKACRVGTRGTITLVDSTVRLSNGQTADRWEAIWAAGCPGFTQGTTNRGSPNAVPPTGGRGGGQFADVRITVR
jgi:hypothetical protein